MDAKARNQIRDLLLRWSPSCTDSNACQLYNATDTLLADSERAERYHKTLERIRGTLASTDWRLGLINDAILEPTHAER